MHVVDMVFFLAKCEPCRPAVIQPDMVTTFQGLADAIESIGDRIDRLYRLREQLLARKKELA